MFLRNNGSSSKLALSVCAGQSVHGFDELNEYSSIGLQRSLTKVFWKGEYEGNIKKERRNRKFLAEYSDGQGMWRQCERREQYLDSRPSI